MLETLELICWPSPLIESFVEIRVLDMKLSWTDADYRTFEWMNTMTGGTWSFYIEIPHFSCHFRYCQQNCPPGFLSSWYASIHCVKAASLGPGNLAIGLRYKR